MATRELRQAWPRPGDPRPVVLIGAGNVVRHGHLPAYRRLGLPLAGVFDLRHRAAQQLARHFRIHAVHRTLPEAARAGAASGAVFDVAVPPDQFLPVLRELPERAVVLLQTPLGRDLAEARRIAALCRRRRFLVAVNFQLRFSPNMLALADALQQGLLGTVRDVELRLVTHTPVMRWPLLEDAPRLDVLYHAIQYLDLARALFGEPERVWCWAGAEPELPRHADTRSTILLDVEPRLRVQISTNHQHTYGARRHVCELKVEGTLGAAVARLGHDLASPKPRPDTLELARGRRPWEKLPLRGSWFPRAFEGSMCSLLRVAAREDDVLPTSLDDALRTMALVEACYRSADKGGTRIPAP